MLSIPELHDHIACDRVWSRRLQHWHDNMLLDMGMAAAAIHAKMVVLIIIISFLLDVLMLRLPVTSVYQPTSRYHDESMLECCRNANKRSKYIYPFALIYIRKMIIRKEP